MKQFVFATVFFLSGAMNYLLSNNNSLPVESWFASNSIQEVDTAAKIANLENDVNILNQRVEQLKEENSKAVTSIQSHEEKQLNLQSQIEQLSAQLKEKESTIKNQLQKLSESEQELTSLNSELQKKDESHRQLEESNKSLTEDKNSLNNTIQELESSFENTSTEITSLTNELREKNNSYGILEQKIKILEAQAKSHQNDFLSIQNELSLQQTEIKNKSEAIQKLKVENTQIKELNIQLSEQKKNEEDNLTLLSKQKAELEIENIKLQDDIASISSDLKISTERINTLHELENTHEDLINSANNTEKKLKAEIDELKLTIEANNTTNKNLQEEIRELKQNQSSNNVIVEEDLELE